MEHCREHIFGQNGTQFFANESWGELLITFVKHRDLFFILVVDDTTIADSIHLNGCVFNFAQFDPIAQMLDLKIAPAKEEEEPEES